MYQSTISSISFTPIGHVTTFHPQLPDGVAPTTVYFNQAIQYFDIRIDSYNGTLGQSDDHVGYSSPHPSYVYKDVPYSVGKFIHQESQGSPPDGLAYNMYTPTWQDIENGFFFYTDDWYAYYSGDSRYIDYNNLNKKFDTGLRQATTTDTIVLCGKVTGFLQRQPQ